MKDSGTFASLHISFRTSFVSHVYLRPVPLTGHRGRACLSGYLLPSMAPHDIRAVRGMFGLLCNRTESSAHSRSKARSCRALYPRYRLISLALKSFVVGVSSHSLNLRVHSLQNFAGRVWARIVLQDYITPSHCKIHPAIVDTGELETRGHPTSRLRSSTSPAICPELEASIL